MRNHEREPIGTTSISRTEASIRGVAMSAFACLSLAAPAFAQIPADQYLRFVPLEYPSLVRQTRASEQFHLFGDPRDPAYRDEGAKDGIDDRRAEWLRQLSVRFAPLMVRNTPLYPMDFRVFYSRPGFGIHVDGWNLARANASAIDRTIVPLNELEGQPCIGRAPASGADCRLVELIKTYGPGRAPVEPEASGGAEVQRFTVMYLDPPGHDEATWRAEYWPQTGDLNRRSPALAGAERVFVHPFVAEVANSNGRVGYELVLQYWFYYPENDGPNNHEGDWEHINVVVSPRSRVMAPLDGASLASLIGGTLPADADDPLVIRRVEYYLHHFVFVLDYASPNAYAARSEWERQVAEAAKTKGTSRWMWDQIRERAWQDAEETRVNTRPIVWIGGDALGFGTVLEKPGLRDRDGHASYPFRGYYKQIGPATGERVVAEFDARAYFADPASKPEHVEDYADAAKVALVPDWERVSDLVLTDAQVRREWSWLILPLRFGYPATRSPGAGVVAHADTGNLSIVGPSFNGGWNRIGDSSGYELYEGVKLSWATPLGAEDSFFPRLGALNAPILYFLFKPPLDLLWRSIALPIRAGLGTHTPTFVNSERPRQRSVSFEAGVMVTPVSEDFSALFTNRDQLQQLVLLTAFFVPPNVPVSSLTQTNVFPTIAAPVYSLVFHVSPRFSTESALASYKATVGFDIGGPGMSEPIRIRGTLDQFDYHGNTRFNLVVGSRFQPYVKLGAGYTSYQLKGVSVNGITLPTPDSPRFKPEGNWRSLGFNETQVGGGIDISGVALRRARLGLKASYTGIYHPIGFERAADVETFPELAKELAGAINSVWRHELRFLGSVSF
jgi:hypothetical protein